MDEEFFKNYKKQTKPKGIPNVQMNQPLTQNVLPGTIGLELEIEARRPLPRDGHLDFLSPKTKVSWQAVADGSLRGEAREYIFSAPVQRDEVDFMVHELFKRFEALDSRIQNSNRCSTHVHINMKGRTINLLTSVIALWGTFEESLIAWCGEERVTNHFCLSMQNSSSLVDAWDQYLRVGAFEGQGQDRHGLKYMAFNILPLWRKGSFEFRCGGAPNDPKNVITWATFLDAFVEYACTRYTNPATIASDLSERGGTAIFADICGEEFAAFAREVIGEDEEDFNEKCLRGFRVVQPLVLGYPWETWMELINKEYIPDPFAKPKKGATLAPPRRGARLEPIAMPDIDWREIAPAPEAPRAMRENFLAPDGRLVTFDLRGRAIYAANGEPFFEGGREPAHEFIERRARWQNEQDHERVREPAREFVERQARLQNEQDRERLRAAGRGL